MAKIDMEGELDIKEVEIIQQTLTQVKIKLGGREVPHGGIQFPSQDELDVPISMLTAEDCAKELLQEEIPRLVRIGHALKQVRDANLRDLGVQIGLKVR